MDDCCYFLHLDRLHSCLYMYHGAVDLLDSKRLHSRVCHYNRLCLLRMDYAVQLMKESESVDKYQSTQRIPPRKHERAKSNRVSVDRTKNCVVDD